MDMKMNQRITDQRQTSMMMVVVEGVLMVVVVDLVMVALVVVVVDLVVVDLVGVLVVVVVGVWVVVAIGLVEGEIGKLEKNTDIIGSVILISGQARNCEISSEFSLTSLQNSVP